MRVISWLHDLHNNLIYAIEYVVAGSIYVQASSELQNIFQLFIIKLRTAAVGLEQYCLDD